MSEFQKQALSRGAKIGVCEVKSVISGDRFGILYRALNHHLNGFIIIYEYFPREIAVRSDDQYSVQPKSKSDEKKFRSGLDKFLTTGESFVRIEHRCVNSVQNALELNGTVYLIMDYVSGLSLQKIFDSAVPYSENDLRAMLTGLLEAVGEIHGQGLVHGSICPENILIKNNGEPVLVNFSTFQAAVASADKIDSTDLHNGFAPVEQYNSGNSTRPATDLYALGATMYLCIGHISPISAIDRFSATKHGQADPLPSIRTPGTEHYSEKFLEIIDWMLRLSTEDRPQSVAEVLEALGNCDSTRSTPPDQARSEWLSGFPFFGLANPQNAGWSSLFFWFGILVIAEFLFFGGNSDRFEATDLKPNKQFETVHRNDGPENAHRSIPLTEKPASMEFAGYESATAIRDSVSQTHKNPVQQNIDRHGQGDNRLSESKQVAALMGITEESGKSADKDDLVEMYLAAARKSLDELRLTTPAKNNAVHYYRAVLDANPHNPEALRGLDRVVEIYAWIINGAINKGNPKLARLYFDRASPVIPNSPDLESIRGRLVQTEHIESGLPR